MRSDQYMINELHHILSPRLPPKNLTKAGAYSGWVTILFRWIKRAIDYR